MRYQGVQYVIFKSFKADTTPPKRKSIIF